MLIRGRSRRSLPLVAALLIGAIVLLVAASPANARSRATPRLTAFSSCEDLLRFGRAGLAMTGGRAGVPLRAGAAPTVISTPPILTGPIPAKAAPPLAASSSPPVDIAATPGGDSSDQSFSATNNHEAGVDEPDVIKTDGHYVYAVSDGKLHVVDVTSAAPRLMSTTDLEGYGQEILLRGTRLLVVATKGTSLLPGVGGPVPTIAPGASVDGPGDPTTLLTEIDISHPAAPQVARTLTVKGTFVDARRTDGTVRIVIGSSPQGIPAGEDQGAAIRHAGARTFIPRTTMRSRLSGHTFRRSIATCRQIRHPRSFSGAGLLTVLTVDLDRGLDATDRDAIMAGAQVVYGSADNLYVASEQYRPAVEEGKAVPDNVRTEIHRFDATAPGRTTYAGSGDVPGFILNQYALSERDGVLRVASTEQPPWWPTASSDAVTIPAQQTGISTLQIRSDGLVRRARVSGLGEGENVYAVRFLGDRAYVVTFRQVDPLYVVDLHDPDAPRTVGELKVAGYSAYLHPISDDLLLGVGQDATEQGIRRGAQVSLFDVADPTAPKRVARHALGSGSSTVEFDPHAFLYWPKTRLAVLPINRFQPDPFTGALGLRVGTTDIKEVGRIDHGTAERPRVDVDRSLVVAGRVVSLSYRGIGTSQLDTLAPVGFAAFGEPDGTQEDGDSGVSVPTAVAAPGRR